MARPRRVRFPEITASPSCRAPSLRERLRCRATQATACTFRLGVIPGWPDASARCGSESVTSSRRSDLVAAPRPRCQSSFSASSNAAPEKSGTVSEASPGTKASGIGTSLGGAAKGGPHQERPSVAAPKGDMTPQTRERSRLSLLPRRVGEPVPSPLPLSLFQGEGLALPCTWPCPSVERSDPELAEVVVRVPVQQPIPIPRGHPAEERMGRAALLRLAIPEPEEQALEGLHVLVERAGCVVNASRGPRTPCGQGRR